MSAGTHWETTPRFERAQKMRRMLGDLYRSCRPVAGRHIKQVRMRDYIPDVASAFGISVSHCRAELRAIEKHDRANKTIWEAEGLLEECWYLDMMRRFGPSRDTWGTYP